MLLRFEDERQAVNEAHQIGAPVVVWHTHALHLQLAHCKEAVVGRPVGTSPISEVDHLRMGYGVALQVYSESAFLFEASVASSIDGGLFINLTFNPTFDAQERWR